MNFAYRSFCLLLGLLVSLACTTPFGFAQDNNSDTTGVDGSNIQQSGGRRLRIGDSAQAGSSDSSIIKGRCIMVKTDDNPIGGYCAEVALVLFDESGKSVGQVRTDRQGNFKINVDDPAASYHFGASSASYEVQGPNKPVKGGQRAILRLKLKK